VLPSRKRDLAVAEVGATDAVKVTDCKYVEGVGLTRMVVVAACTTWVNTGEVAPVTEVSPLLHRLNCMAPAEEIGYGESGRAIRHGDRSESGGAVQELDRSVAERRRNGGCGM